MNTLLQRSLCCCIGLLITAGCQEEPVGPTLPQDIGFGHPSGGDEIIAPEEGRRATLQVGQRVWGNLQGAGFFFPAVLVAQRENEHHLVYADGQSEWLNDDAVRQFALEENQRIHVRSTVGANFGRARVLNTVGRAIRVRLATGEEHWATYPHVRMAAADLPRHDAESTPGSTEFPGTGSRAWVNYEGQGYGFAATITSEREDGRLHVVYADGETGWVVPNRTTSGGLTDGTTVEIRRRWHPAEWLRGTVRQQLADAVQVQYQEGPVGWTSLLRLRTLVTRPEAEAENILSSEERAPAAPTGSAAQKYEKRTATPSSRVW